MKGVQFLVDDRGTKTAAVINLKQHSELWEDFYDSAVADARKKEPRESLESAKKGLSSLGSQTHTSDLAIIFALRWQGYWI